MALTKTSLESRHSVRYRTAVSLLALFAAGCPAKHWPVPVPYEKADDRKPWRFEVALPVSCEARSAAELEQNPLACRDLKALRDYLSVRMTAVSSFTAGAFAVDDDLWMLMLALTSREALGVNRFPRDAAKLPKSVREVDTEEVLDSRDATPPHGRSPVAFLYRRFWWTFWVKDSAPPLPPEDGGSAQGGESFDRLIVFPEFQGRQTAP